MEIKVIKTEQDYNRALKRLEDFFHAAINTREGDEAELLSILIEKYKRTWLRFLALPVGSVKFLIADAN